MWMVALIAGLGAWLASATVEAAVINVQPIVVCNNNGTGCAANPLTDANYEAFTDKILHQLFPNVAVGDTVAFLPVNTFNSTAFNTITCTVSPCPQLQSLFAGAPFNNVPVPVDRGQSADPTVYNMWFVDEITAPTNSTLFGLGAYPGNGTVIHADRVIATDRLDILAHELGHNFGFAGTADGHLTDPNFLLAHGDLRTVPTALNQISTDGLTGFDRLPPSADAPAAQVNTLGDTPFGNSSFFNFEFNNSKPGVSLTTLILDISPIGTNFVPPGGFFDPTTLPPGLDPFPLTFNNNPSGTFTNCSGLTTGDITAVGDLDGGQVLTLGFTPGKVTEGCAFSFSIDIDLFAKIDQFGATPAELQGSIFNFTFSNGYNIAAALADNVASTIFDPTKIPVTAFRIADINDVVPVPGTLLLVSLGGITLAAWRRRAR
jgi:hypothetical protein